MKKGFTLAEVLITLAIIGIVAAITIPTLMADVNQKAFDNQRKTLHSRLANALTAMDKLSGYGIYDDSDEENIKDTAAESFVVDGLSKVYKIKNICTFDKKDKCGVPESFTSLGGIARNYPETLSDLMNGYTIDSIAPVAFETNNGESIVAYYNPKCNDKKIPSPTHEVPFPSVMCVNFIYDLNGPKAPNMMGKDMGIITAFYKEEPIVVAPVADEKSTSVTEATTQFEAADKCANLGDDYRIPTMEELGAIAVNNSHMNFPAVNFWSSTILKPGVDAGTAVRAKLANSGIFIAEPRSASAGVFCIKR